MQNKKIHEETRHHLYALLISLLALCAIYEYYFSEVEIGSLVIRPVIPNNVIGAQMVGDYREYEKELSQYDNYFEVDPQTIMNISDKKGAKSILRIADPYQHMVNVYSTVIDADNGNIYSTRSSFKDTGARLLYRTMFSGAIVYAFRGTVSIATCYPAGPLLFMLAILNLICVGFFSYHYTRTLFIKHVFTNKTIPGPVLW